MVFASGVRVVLHSSSALCLFLFFFWWEEGVFLS